MQTIELPATEGGYYRFGDLPRTIAEARQPTKCPSDNDGATLWWLHVIDAEKRFSKWLTDAANRRPGTTGYLYIVDSFNKLTLEFRQGYALENGLVHIDSLNEWGASQIEPIAFVAIGQRTQREIKPGFRSRRALIRELTCDWPDIESDLREASRNGLNAARVPGLFGYWETAKALAWAEGNGKIQPKGKQPGGPWPGLVTRHVTK